MSIARLSVTGLVVSLVLSACGQENSAEKPAPFALPDTAIGYFCGMTVTNHNGPKGQIFLKGQSEPLWFVSVRDTLAFTRMPDEAHKVRAVYVTDMGVAGNWDQPEDESWREADRLWYVAGAAVQGGMGGNELVPFADKAKAEAFITNHGGSLLHGVEAVETDLLLGDGHMVMEPGAS